MRDGRAGWDEMASVYDATRAIPGGGEEAALQRIAERIAAHGVTRLLEVGVGTGRMALPIARSGVSVVGVDRTPEMLAHLVAKRGAVPLPVVRGDAAALPFRSAFDGVLFSHFLHLVADLAAFAREIRRVAVLGARAFVVDTGYEPAPARVRAMHLILPLLGLPFEQLPTGERSKDRDLFDSLLAHLGAAPSVPEPIGRYPGSSSLRWHLDHARKRSWWTMRRHPADAVERAVDAATERLLAEGADLDAPVAEPVGVRLLVARLP